MNSALLAGIASRKIEKNMPKCPCGKPVSTYVKGRHVVLNFKCYGNSYQICRHCHSEYADSRVTEAADALSFSRRVPFPVTGYRFIVFLAVCIVLCIVGAAAFGEAGPLIGIPYLLGLYLVVSAVSIPCRKKRLKKVIQDSRDRLKNRRNFEKFLRTKYREEGLKQLSDDFIADLHAEAIARMDADQPVEIEDLMYRALKKLG